MSIFVQLVSYKNFDVVSTVRDCIEKAYGKAGLRFGLVLQQDEDVPAELNIPNVSVQKFSVADSKGHGWARSVAQGMYSSEDYTLQVDSGTRFAQGWDTSLIEALRNTGKEKPVIGNCPNKFNPENGEMEVPGSAYKLQPHMFLENVPSCWASPMKGVTQIEPSKILSESFFFTLGSHCRECPYDPSLYWSELDSALTIKSFTSGYDLFNHFVPLAWMNYSPRPRHWDDHQDWWIASRLSADRFAAMLAGDGLGTVRTLQEYQRYSGIDFLNRKIHKDVYSGKNPPINYVNESSWESSLGKDYSIAVSWNTEEIEKCDDYDYWQFSVEDAAGNDILKYDLRPDRESPTLEFKTNWRKVMLKVFDGKIPTTFSICPFSKSKGQLRKSKFQIGDQA
jgi:hypothetical protein